MGRTYDEHSFFCTKCGNKGIPLFRKQGHQHSRFHKKKLWCVHCKEEVNHIECKTFDEVLKFKEDFEKGVYKNEVNDFDRCARIG